MTQPTTEQMVKELDAKFEGASMIYKACNGCEESNAKAPLLQNPDYSYGGEFGGWLTDHCGDYFSLCLYDDVGVSHREFYDVNIEGCISQAHDYFITKGGEL